MQRGLEIRAFLSRVMLDRRLDLQSFLKRFVKPGAPGPLSLEALVALKLAGRSPIAR